jgi:hypothetical protein
MRALSTIAAAMADNLERDPNYVERDPNYGVQK